MIAKVHLRSSRYVFEMTPDPLDATVQASDPRSLAWRGQDDERKMEKVIMHSYPSSAKEEAFLEGSNLLNQPELNPTGAPTQANGTSSTTTKLYSARSVSQ